MKVHPRRLFRRAALAWAAAAVCFSPAHAVVYVWSDGFYTAQPRPVLIESGSTLRGLSGSDKLLNTNLTNDGTIAWQTSDPLLFFGGGTTLRNNGLFDQQTNGAINFTNGAQTFDNAGTLRKSGGTGDLLIGVQVTNRTGATLAAESGSITYRGSSLFEAGSVFAGAGTHVFDGRASLHTFQGSFVGNGRLHFQAGRYFAAAPVRPQSDFSFSSGTFEGPWFVEQNATMTAPTSSGDAKFIAGTFTNDGTIAWQTSDPLLFFGGGTTLRNHGLFDQQTNGAINFTNGAQTFVNAGTLRKSGGAGEFMVTVGLQNTGVIESRSGTIVLPDNWTNNGTLRGSAAYRSNRLTNAGVITPGDSGAPEITELALTGDLLQTGAGRLSFEVAAGAMADLLNVSGVVGFAGVLQVLNSAGYLPALGDTFRVMNFSAYTGAFADIQALGFGEGIVFEAVYAPQHLDVRVSAVPEPAAWLMFLAGGAWMLRRRCRPA